MITGIHHASITTPNLERALAFYSGLLGMEVVVRWDWQAGNAGADAIYGLKDTAVNMVMLKAGNAFLELFEFASPQGKPNEAHRPVCDAGVTHVCLTVKNIHAEYERLRAAGVPFNCPPQPVPGVLIATYARDPDGNILELLEPDPTGPFALPGAA
jgi:catechol 2,3-dioxygenase-like lactoylglutathione lyase family enzyme